MATKRWDWKGIITVGNHSFLSVTLLGTARDNAKDILQMLAEFESEHPELEVTNWKTSEYTTGVFVFLHDLWVDHRPK